MAVDAAVLRPIADLSSATTGTDEDGFTEAERMGGIALAVGRRVSDSAAAGVSASPEAVRIGSRDWRAVPRGRGMSGLDLGVVGNSHVAALIDQLGRIVWYCCRAWMAILSSAAC